MKTKAAVLVTLKRPLEIVELEIPVLKPGQVLVEIAFSGVCHTQVLEANGLRGEDRFLPHCLGHEGTGLVLETSSSVSKVKIGDRVALSWIKGSGADVPGTVYGWDGRNVNAGAITTFQKHAVISENRLTKLPDEVSLRDAVLLGCALPTGMGAVMNTARPKPGESAAVFGCGGIGLSAILGAKLNGCHPIIAIDRLPEKLDVAKRLGATHTILAEGDVAGALRAVRPAGVDIAIEATGRPVVMALAMECVRQQGGRAVIAGNAHHGEKIELVPWQFNLGKRLLGTWGGDNIPDQDFPRYLSLLAGGHIPIDEFLSVPYGLEQASNALKDLEEGRGVRPVIEMAL